MIVSDIRPGMLFTSLGIAMRSLHLILAVHNDDLYVLSSSVGVLTFKTAGQNSPVYERPYWSRVV